jgi:hypothetical protein
MFDFLGEILLGIVIAIFEALGDIVLDGVIEVIAKIPVAVWSTLQSLRQELWR